MGLLRKATTRRIFDRVADDTATVLSSRGSSYAGSVSQSSRRSFSFSDRDADFNNTLANSPVYLRARQPQRTPTTVSSETHPTMPSGNQSPFTDEGYVSNRTGTGLTVPSLEIPPTQQENFLALPNSPSGPVHSRSVSHNQVPTRSNLNGIRRNASDSKASASTPRTSGSKLERMASFLGRINTRSRGNVALSPGGSPNLSVSPSSGRRRNRLDTELSSVDLNANDADSIPQIIKASQAGSRDEVERLLELGSDIESRHRKTGRNALLVAAHCGKEDVVELLIHHNARLAVVDRNGDTALHLAASRGHCGVLELLIPEVDLIETQNSRGRTALRTAADCGQPEALDVLLAFHAEVNGRTQYENQTTALHAASKRGDEEIVQKLVSHGADLEAKDGLMMTALHYACAGGHLEVVKLLLDHRANIEAPGCDRKTPLICAAERGRAQAIELLLKRKATSRATDDGGMTAIHWAAYNGHQEAVRVLSERKGSLDMVNNMGRTALHLAAMQSQFAVVELLQRKGMSLDRRCKAGFTALHYACMADCLEITSLLLLTGADIEAVESEHRQRPLHIVSVRGSVQLLDLLCDKGASLDVRNGAGDRPLCVASRYGHVAAVQRLLDRGSPLCLKFDTGFTEDSILCLAAMGGHWPVVSLLLDRGASVLKKDEAGWQSLRYAAYHGHADVLRLLLSNSKIPEAEIPDFMRMPETIGFSQGVPEENKSRVREVFMQTFGHHNPMPLPAQHLPNGAFQAIGPSHSVSRNFSPSSIIMSPYEADSSTPQELPGSLDQGPPSSRVLSPGHTHNSGTEPSRPSRQNATPHSRRLNEANLPFPSDRLAALLDERRREPQPQRRTETRSPSRSREESPRLSATFTPVSALSLRGPPTPSPPPQLSRTLPYNLTGFSTAPSTVPGPVQPPQPAEVPRSMPLHDHLTQLTTSNHDENHDDSGSDADSISSVYTAPEDSGPDLAPSLNNHTEVKQVS